MSYVYLPSAEDKKCWDDLASEAGVPLSKFVIEIVENALAEESDMKPRAEIVKELGSLKANNSEGLVDFMYPFYSNDPSSIPQ